MKNFFKIFSLALALAGLALGQTATTSTTLSSAIADSVTQTIVVGSATNVNAPTGSHSGSKLYIDREVMDVTAVNGTTLTVARGVDGTRAIAHISGATVYVGYASTQGTPDALVKTVPKVGACTAANEYYLPQIAIDPIYDGSGVVQDCFGGSWQWNPNVPWYTLTIAPQALRAASAATVGNVISLTSQAGSAQSATTGNGGAGGAASLTGAVGGVGGTSSGTGGAGGAAAVTAGAGAGTITGGVGGAATLTAGAGGAGSTTAGTGGAASVTGGAGPSTAGTSGVGGAANVTGGAGSVSTLSAGTGGAGGVTTVAGGAGGVASTGAATGGAGGALALKGGAGAGTITGGAGGSASVLGGAGANGSTAGGSGGAVILQAGAAGTGGTGTAGKVTINDATDATKQVLFSLASGTTSSATTLAISQTTNRTLTLPDNTGGVPVVYSCGSTGTGNQTCTPAAANLLTKIYNGQSTLSSNAATITFAQGGFTSTTSFFCVANDVTTRANPVQMVPASATTATITNTTGGSDVIQWACVGQ